MRSSFKYNLFKVFLVFSTSLFIMLPLSSNVHADPWPAPPFWDIGGGPATGPAVHYTPIYWPATDNDWIFYTHQQTPIKDARSQDPSNGGRAPQNYANISSSCTDQSQPSVAWQYDDSDRFNKTLLFRWKVEQIPNTYGTGPSPGAYSSVDPWKAAQWTVLIDIDGDGFREFAVHVDGPSGTPSEPIDVLKSVYSNTLSQSIDYEVDPNIHLLAHNPTAFVDQGTNRILNFRSNLDPTPNWPNGSAETEWDYGTSRVIDTTTPTCSEYNVDYQIPLAMLDASSVGGPALTADTPFCMTFVTANSNIDPLQKDVAFDGIYTFGEDECIPCGDLITLNGRAPIPQPVVDWVTAEGCNTTTLAAQVRDAINPDCQHTLSSVDFYYYYDENGNGQDDDSGSWTFIGAGSVDPDNPGLWTLAGWDTTGLHNGQYLIGVRAEDLQGNITWSYIDPATVSPPNYGNPAPVPGVVYDTFYNSCGQFAEVTKSVSPASTTVGNTVDFTITVNNQTGAPLTVSSLSDLLPPNFTFVSNNGGTPPLNAPTTSPVAGASGTITWTYAPAVTILDGNSSDLIFTVNVGLVEGTYSNVANAITTEEGTLTSNPVDVGVGAPMLTIAKAASDYSVDVDDTVTYTITYSNDSPVNTTGVTITDAIPSGLNFVGASNGGTYDSGTRTITWNVGSLASMEGPYTVSFSVTVDNSASAKTVNIATIDSNETAPASASAAIFVNSPLDLQKTANKTLIYPSAGAPDSQVTYTIYFENTGSSALTGVTITDSIPAGFSYISHTDAAPFTGSADEVIGDGYGDDDGTCEAVEPCIVTWTALPAPPGTLSVGASGSVTLTVEADDPYTGDNYAVNSATISSNEAPDVSDSATVGVVETGGICEAYFFHDETIDVGFDGIQKISDTISPVPADTGASVTVDAPGSSGPFLEALRFYNPVASEDQVLSDTINTRIYIDRESGNGITIRGEIFDYDPVTGNTVSLGSFDQDFNGNKRGLHEFNISPSGTLLAGHRILWVFSVRSQHATKTVRLQLQYDGTVSNDLSLTTPDTFANSHARLCASVPALILTKDVDKKSAVAGDSLQYTLSFSNLGVNNATGSQIVDILPTGTTFVSATLNGSSVTPTILGQQLTFNVNSSDTSTGGQITGGESGELIINATIDNPLAAGITSLTNNAELTSNETDPVSDAVTTNIGLSSSPDVTILKSAGKTLLFPGDTVTYTLTVVNTGGGTASTVQVTDVLPTDTYYTYVAGSITGGDSRSDAGAPTLTWTINTMNPGDSTTLTYQMVVDNTGLVPAGVNTKSNTATATEATTGPYSSNTVTITITANANLQVSKSVSSPAAMVETACSSPCASTVDYSLTNTPVQTGKVIVYDNGVQVGVDNGTGVIIGGNLQNSTIDYTTGAIHLEFISSPSGDVTVSYNQPANPGDTIVYTVTVESTGGSTADNVLVNDPIPTYSTYQNGTLEYDDGSGSGLQPRTDENDADNAYFDATNNRVVFSVGNLARGQTRDMTFTVVVDSEMPNGTTSVTNTATASASNTASKNGIETFNVQAAPSLSLRKSAPDVLAWPLTTLAAPAFPITDKISVNSTSYFSVGDVITVGGVPAQVIAVTSRPVLLTTVAAFAPAGANNVQVNSTANISIGDWININDGIFNNTVTQVTNIVGTILTINPALTFNAAVGNPVNAINVFLSAPVTGGIGTAVRPALKFRLVYTNSGDAEATNVVVRDTLQPGLTFIPAPFSSSECSNVGQLVSCGLGTLSAGESGVLTVHASIGGTGAYTNFGQMVSDELPTFDSNTTTTAVGGIELTKSTSTPSVINNPTDGPDVATYTITITPQIAQPVFPLTVTDTLPEGFTYNGNLIYGGGGFGETCFNAPVIGATEPSWTNCIIPVGSFLTITFDALIAPTVPTGIYDNVVTAVDNSASPLPVLPFDETATTAEDVSVTVPDDLKVVKGVTFTDGCFAVGCRVTYDITVTNVGTTMGTTQVIDILPPELTYQSSTATLGSYDGAALWSGIGPLFATSSVVEHPPASGITYTCIQNHVATPADEPGIGINWTNVWQPGGTGSAAWIPGLNYTSATATLYITATINTVTRITNIATIDQPNTAFAGGGTDTNPSNDQSSRSMIPTLVSLADFRAYEDNGKVVVEWTTSSEIDTAGFYLYRFDKTTDTYSRINNKLLPALITSPEGGTYSLIDRGVSPDGTYTYILVEMEGKGTRNTYGPFTVQVGGEGTTDFNAIPTQIPSEAGKIDNKGLSSRTSKQHSSGVSRRIRSDGTIVISGGSNSRSTSNVARQTKSDGTVVVNIGNTPQRGASTVAIDLYTQYKRKKRDVPAEKKAASQAVHNQRETVKNEKKRRSGITAKIAITEDGLYYLDGAKIANMLDLMYEDVVSRIRRNRIALSNQGQPVAYIPAEDNTGIFFYGKGEESIYTSANIYWLSQEKGLRMDMVRGKIPENTGSGTFAKTLHFEKDSYPAISIANDPESDYWYWDYIATYPDMDRKTFDFEAYGVADVSKTGFLTVHLKGGTDTEADPDHHVQISLNGILIGEDWWNGTGSLTVVFPFDQDLLFEGSNTLEVAGLMDEGIPYSIFHLDSFDLTYERVYEAVDNMLLYSVKTVDTKAGFASMVQPLTIHGFTEPDIFVFDLSDPYQPKVLDNTSIDNSGVSYSVSFMPFAPDIPYMAITPDAARMTDNAWADIPSNLMHGSNQADYIIITPDELIEPAEQLAAYREGQGLRSMVVNLEDIMDEFNYGISSPQAIQNFLRHAYVNWASPPRYIVLAGEGTYDYKDNQGHGDNLVPTKIVKTPFGLFPSDNYFADADGDHVPDMAVGRLTAVSVGEMENLIDKIVIFEAGAVKRFITAVDRPDDGGNYPADSDDIAAFVSPNYPVKKIYLSDYALDTARQLLINEINAGASFMNYVGHGAVDRLSGSGLLMTSDVADLTNATGLPVVTALTCVVGQFALPGYDSLSEALLNRDGGGAVAVLAPSGLAFNDNSVTFGKMFYRNIFEKGQTVLGNAVLNAFKEYDTIYSGSFILDTYNLQGDPALKLQ